MVDSAAGAPDLLYVDMHLVHEVTSTQPFEGMQLLGRPVHRPDLTIATTEHKTPTGPEEIGVMSRKQLEELERNRNREGIRVYNMVSAQQGIVQVNRPGTVLTPAGLNTG